jgi:hypothetical protein
MPGDLSHSQLATLGGSDALRKLALFEVMVMVASWE